MQTALSNRLSSSQTESFSATTGRIVIGLAATAVIALAAHVAFPLPFTPVPFTLQPLAVLGVGLALGPVGGFLTLLAYLAEGACGLPVFSPTGPGGLAQLFGATGGYLLAYPLMAAIVGGLARWLSHRMGLFSAAALAGTAAVSVLFVSGAAWLLMWTHASLHTVWIAAILPFLPGEAVKILAAAGVYSTLLRYRQNKLSAPSI